MELTPALFPEYFTAPQRGTRVKPGYLLTKVDEEILQAVWDFRFLTAEQILRYRGLSQNSLPKLRERLFILSGESDKVKCPAYLQRFYQSRNTPHGTLPFVYALSPLGKKTLERIGFDVSAFGRIKKITERLPSDIDHHLSINEFFLAAMQLETIEPRISRYDLQHDWRLKHSPIPASLYRELGNSRSEVQAKFVPDGLLEFRVDLGDRRAPKRVFLEMDMDTHERHEFKKKIAAYIEFFASGTYVKWFGNVRNVVVLFATPAGERRCEEMRRWTHEQFKRPLYSPRCYRNGTNTPDTDDYSLFLFTSLPTGALDPAKTFLSPVCLPLFAEQPRALIRLPQ